jgi:hypothetical protein
MAQVAVGVTQPAGLGGEAEQGLHDGQGDQFGVAELGGDADRGSSWRQLRCLLQQLVDLHVQCRREGVQVGVHEASHKVDVG